MKQDEKITSIWVRDFENQKINLSETYKGETILLIIYNNQCLGCTGRAIPMAYDFQKEFKTIKVIGIHSDFGNKKTIPQEIKAIFTAGETPFPIYLDVDASVFNQFEAEGTPQWVIITKEGTFYRSFFGSQENSENRLGYALASLNL